jgi:hypothetical protein
MGDDLRENWPSNMGERFAWGDRAQQRVHNWEREFNNQLAANRGDVGMATGMTNSLMGYEHREPTPANMAGHFQPDRQVHFPSQEASGIYSVSGTNQSGFVRQRGPGSQAGRDSQSAPVNQAAPVRQRRNIGNLEDSAPRGAPLSSSERSEQEQYLRRVEGVNPVDQFGNLANVRYDSPNQGRSREPIEGSSAGRPAPLERRNAGPRADTPYDLDEGSSAGRPAPLQRRNALPRANAPYEGSSAAGGGGPNPVSSSYSDRNADMERQILEQQRRNVDLASQFKQESDYARQELIKSNRERTAAVLGPLAEYRHRMNYESNFWNIIERDNFKFLVESEFWKRGKTYQELKYDYQYLWPHENGRQENFEYRIPNNRRDDDIETKEDYAVRVEDAVRHFLPRTSDNLNDEGGKLYRSIWARVKAAQDYANYYRNRYSSEYPTIHEQSDGPYFPVFARYRDAALRRTFSSIGRSLNKIGWAGTRMRLKIQDKIQPVKDAAYRKIQEHPYLTASASVATIYLFRMAVPKILMYLCILMIINKKLGFLGGNSKKTKRKHTLINKTFVKKIVNSLYKLIQKYNCNIEIDMSKINYDEIIRMANKMTVEMVNTELNKLKIEYNINISTENKEICGKQLQLPPDNFILSFVEEDMKTQNQTHSRNKTSKSITVKSRSKSLSTV